MNNWQKVRLGDVCSYVSAKIPVKNISVKDYISTENMLPNKGGVACAASVPVSGAVTAFKKHQILISNIRPYFRKIWFADKMGGCSNDVLCFNGNSLVDSRYLYYILSQDSFFDYVMLGANGSKMPRGDKKQIMDWSVLLPDLKTQRQIAAILGAIDAKIELNRRLNDNLEQQAQAIFKSWFVDFEPFRDGEFVESELGMIPKGWSIGGLLDVAEYLNGLAMQRYRPTRNEIGIPVLKIKELRQGMCDESSELCSGNIKSDFVVNNVSFAKYN